MLAGAQQAATVVDWSWWRRRHQGVAAWYHSRRRARRLPPAPVCDAAGAPVGQPAEEPAAAAVAFAQPGAQTDAELLAQLWERLEPLLPAQRRAGRKLVYDRRQILAAIVHVLQTDCGWCALPSRFPPWKTVHALFVSWRKSGIWNQIWQGLLPPDARSGEQLQL